MAKRKCKVCGCVFEKPKNRSFQDFCSIECGVKLGMERRRKAAIKAKAEAKRKERARTKALRHRLETVPELTKKAQQAFNRYIRLRDRGKPCISCGTPWKENFLYESGNLRGYRIGLIERIGVERVEQLETDHEARKWTKEELRELAAEYRRKAREIE